MAELGETGPTARTRRTTGAPIDSRTSSARPGAAAARTAAALLFSLAIPLGGLGTLMVLTLRFAWVGLPLAGWAALAMGCSLVTWLRPGEPADRWTLAVALASSLGTMLLIRTIRPLDAKLGVTIAALTIVLAASALLAWSRFAPLLAAGPHPRSALLASAIAGVALVIVAAIAPLADQPPFTPLRLSAVAETDRDCGRIHVDDPRGMGSPGFDSVDSAPDGWRRRRGTLVLTAHREGWFEADGRSLALVPSNGVSPCFDARRTTRRRHEVVLRRLSRPSPPSAAR